MDYDHGLRRMKSLLKSLNEIGRSIADFDLHEGRLRDNLGREKRYGYTQEISSERSTIMDQLNILCRQYLKCSFNDLCIGEDKDITCATPANSTFDNTIDQYMLPPVSFYGTTQLEIAQPIIFPQNLMPLSTKVEDLPTLIATSKHCGIVVGINYYEDYASYGPLQVCADEAEALYEQLLFCNFHPSHLHLLTDKTPNVPLSTTILKHLRSVVSVTGPEDTLLLYYIGRIDVDEQNGYLIARNSLRSDLSKDGLSLNNILTIMGNASACAKILCLDACCTDIANQEQSLSSIEEQRFQRFLAPAHTFGSSIAVFISCQHTQPKSLKHTFTYHLVELLKKHSLQESHIVSCTNLFLETNRYLNFHLATAQDIIFCLSYQQNPASYYVIAYPWLLKVRNILIAMLPRFTRSSPFYESEYGRLLRWFDQLQTPAALSRGLRYNPEEYTLRDQLYTIYQHIEDNLRWDISYTKKGIISPVIQQRLYAAWDALLTTVCSLVSKLRNENLFQ